MLTFDASLKLKSSFQELLLHNKLVSANEKLYCTVALRHTYCSISTAFNFLHFFQEITDFYPSQLGCLPEVNTDYGHAKI